MELVVTDSLCGWGGSPRERDRSEDGYGRLDVLVSGSRGQSTDALSAVRDMFLKRGG